MRGLDQHAWIKHLEGEPANLRAALGWLIQAQQVEQAARLAAALTPFWEHQGLLGKGRRWLEDVLAIALPAPSEVQGFDPQVRLGNDAQVVFAKTLNAAGGLVYRQGDYPRAKGRLEQS